MNPEVDRILGISAEQLTAQIVPDLGTSYLKGYASVVALLMRFAAREYEHGADIRATENADLRGLFAEIAPVVGESALKAKLEAAAATRDGSLAISALNQVNAELRRLLIALQVHVEGIGDRASQKTIWRVLKAMAARRVISL